MPSVIDFVSPGDIAVGLPTHELAIQLLKFFNSANATGGSSMCHPGNVLNRGNWAGHDVGNWPLFSRAVSEAWAYLVANALVSRVPENGEFQMITRRGMDIAKAANPVQRLVDDARLAQGLHDRLNQKTRGRFLAGDYEDAAFMAMREVEIRVRELAKASNSEIGVKLVQRVLRKGGPLDDPSLDEGEREATMALFWGAIGVFKNPSSHRQVDFDDPTDGAEIILLADLLLRLLDKKAADLGLL